MIFDKKNPTMYFEMHCQLLFIQFQNKFDELKHQIIKSATDKFVELSQFQQFAQPAKPSYPDPITCQQKTNVKPRNTDQKILERNPIFSVLLIL